jgi:cold shock CspA family protein
MRGVVTEFDDAAGMGWLTDDDGGRWFFHCTQIADGTRTIAIETPVTFESLPFLGRYEATAIQSAVPLTLPGRPLAPLLAPPAP